MASRPLARSCQRGQAVSRCPPQTGRPSLRDACPAADTSSHLAADDLRACWDPRGGGLNEVTDDASTCRVPIQRACRFSRLQQAFGWPSRCPGRSHGRPAITRSITSMSCARFIWSANGANGVRASCVGSATPVSRTSTATGGGSRWPCWSGSSPSGGQPPRLPARRALLRGVDLEYLRLARELDSDFGQNRHETLAERLELLPRVPDLAHPQVLPRAEADVVVEPLLSGDRLRQLEDVIDSARNLALARGSDAP